VGPYIPYDLQTKGEMCAKFGRDRFRNVDLYKLQTNKHKNEQKTISALYVRYGHPQFSHMQLIRKHPSCTSCDGK
jgi:hypothetical protein